MNKSLNDGNIHSFDEVKKHGLEKSATEFSEGSDVLKKVLLDLWDMGLETKACCKGTIEKDHKSDIHLRFPYIYLVVNGDNSQKIVDLISYILAEDSKTCPTISFVMYNNVAFGKSLVLDRFFFTNNGTKKMFETISSATTKLKKNDLVVDSELIKNVRPIFNKIANSTSLDAIRLEFKIRNNRAQLFIEDYDNKLYGYNVTGKNVERINDALDEFLCVSEYKNDEHLGKIEDKELKL